jgi:hypothetical protein
VLGGRDGLLQQLLVGLRAEVGCATGQPVQAGEDLSHARMLAEAEGDLPSVVLHRATMCVIDGMHRLRAAELRGDKTIAVRFFDGDDDAAFVLAVQANIAHGLPLSFADREAAAVRIPEDPVPEGRRRLIKSGGGQPSAASMRPRPSNGKQLSRDRQLEPASMMDALRRDPSPRFTRCGPATASLAGRTNDRPG